MNYTKPEVVVLGSASNAIQGSGGKENDITVDSFLVNPTTSAYEADE